MKNKLITFAALVVAIAGLKEISGLVSTVILGIFLSIIFLPVTDWMTRRKIPRALSSSLLLLSFAVLVGTLSGYLSSSVSQFISDSPNIVEGLRKYFANAEAYIAGFGVNVHIMDYINVSQAMKTGMSVVEKFGGVMSKAFLVLLVCYFMLLEAPRWNEKIKGMLGSEQGDEIVSRIKVYINVKTATSLITGLLISLCLFLIGHKYWILWGFLAFILNFIPNIGSIIAAVPAVVVAAATMGQVEMGLTILAYVVSNVGIGSFLEPKILGDKLGLSTLVILLSMLFWGWMFDTIGMFLSVPLTISIKILLGRSKVAGLLGN